MKYIKYTQVKNKVADKVTTHTLQEIEINPMLRKLYNFISSQTQITQNVGNVNLVPTL